MDYRIVSTVGFDKDDVKAVENLDNVTDVMPSYFLRRDETGFQMDVRVDEAGADDLAGHIVFDLLQPLQTSFLQHRISLEGSLNTVIPDRAKLIPQQIFCAQEVAFAKQ